jgi:hypothetical protein
MGSAGRRCLDTRAIPFTYGQTPGANESLAERLTVELLAAEKELLERDEPHTVLAIPRSCGEFCATVTRATVRCPRDALRLPLTESGWQIRK